MRAVDTNILIYAHDPRDPEKQRIAEAVIESLTDGAFLWQVACEYIAAARKLAPFGFDQRQAFQNLYQLQSVWTAILPSLGVLSRAEALMEVRHLSSWDALIVAACIEGGITHLYTEDMGAPLMVEGVQIVNPFTEGTWRISKADKELSDRADEDTYLEDAEQAAKRSTSFLQQHSKELNKFGYRLNLHNPTLERIGLMRDDAQRRAQVDQISELFAGDLNAYSSWLEKNVPNFSGDAVRMKEGYTHYLSFITPDIEEPRAKLEFIRGEIAGILAAMQRNMNGARQARDVIVQIGSKFPLIQAASQTATTRLDELISAFTDVESFCLTTLDVINRKLKV